MAIIPTSQPTIARISKQRSSVQTASSIDTKLGTVQNIYGDSLGNTSSADVLLDGQQVPLFGVPNNTGSKLSIGSRVTINFVSGRRFQPQIIAAGGQGTAAAIAGAASVQASNGTAPTAQQIGGIGFVLQAADTIDVPGGYVLEPGANVMLDPIAPRTSDSGGGITPGEIIITARPLVLTALPPGTGFLDGTLVDLITFDSSGDEVPAGMFRWDATKSEWVRRDSGGGGAGSQVQEIPSGAINGSNTVFTLTTPPLTGTLEVFVNGLLELKANFAVSGNTFTLSYAPPTGTALYCIFGA